MKLDWDTVNYLGLLLERTINYKKKEVFGKKPMSFDWVVRKVHKIVFNITSAERRHF